MGYRVSVAGFEGPFDLLLQLVTRQKVAIGAVPIAQIADQYLDEVARLDDLDLEVASDFVLIAATLLELKAAALIEPASPMPDANEEEYEELTADEMRSVLTERLALYRQYKNVAAELGRRFEEEAQMYARPQSTEPDVTVVSHASLEGRTLADLAEICARLLGKREALLLESEHIAPPRIPLETRVEEVDVRVREAKRLSFDELLGEDTSVENRVVSLLALLELTKRGTVVLEQPKLFGSITIDAVRSDHVECL